MMDIGEIQRLLPHRYPFLLVDRVVEIIPGQKLTAYKNVTINEPFFNGHFPGHPVMPGVLILEALAQASAILAYKSENMDPETQGHLPDGRGQREVPQARGARATGCSWASRCCATRASSGRRRAPPRSTV